MRGVILSKTTTKSAKLAVIMSRKSPHAVIVRRGPTRWYHVIKWNLDTDELEYGAWFKGRIYEGKCDLSDDGELLLYSVYKGSTSDAIYRDSYTALSKAPWLKAFALWPQGSTYLGGGEFQGDNIIGIWTFPFMQDMHPDHQDTKGYSIVNLTTSDGWHDDCHFVPEADWSKKDLNGRIIWYTGYDLYIRENEKDQLFVNLKDLTPEPSEAPY